MEAFVLFVLFTADFLFHLNIPICRPSAVDQFMNSAK